MERTKQEVCKEDYTTAGAIAEIYRSKIQDIEYSQTRKSFV